MIKSLCKFSIIALFSMDTMDDKIQTCDEAPVSGIYFVKQYSRCQLAHFQVKPLRCSWSFEVYSLRWLLNYCIFEHQRTPYKRKEPTYPIEIRLLKWTRVKWNTKVLYEIGNHFLKNGPISYQWPRYDGIKTIILIEIWIIQIRAFLP